MILRMLSVGVRESPHCAFIRLPLSLFPEQTKSCLSKVYKKFNRNARVVDSH